MNAEQVARDLTRGRGRPRGAGKVIPTPEQVRELTRQYVELGKSVGDAGAAVGFSRTVAQRILRDHDVEMRVKGWNRRHDLDRRINRQLRVPGDTIMDRLWSGWTRERLARRYGVSELAMRRHVNLMLARRKSAGMPCPAV